MREGKKHFRNKDIISTKALCLSESPFAAQMNQRCEDANSKETLLPRSADAISETETATRDSQKCVRLFYTRKKQPNIERNQAFLAKNWRGK